MTKEEKENLAHNNYPHGSEMPIGSRDRSLYENKKESFSNGLNAAINYTHFCMELPTSTQLLSDCKKRFKELEGKGNLDFRSYKNGYLDSFSKNVISKIK